MTISSDENRWSYTGDGATTAFDYENRIFAASDLKVYLDAVLQVSGYTVSGVGETGGGKVTFGSAPASAAAVLIVREVPYTQPENHAQSGIFKSETANRAYDRLCVQIQQMVSDLARTFRLAPSDSEESIDPIPDKATRAEKFLAFDADGAPIASTVAEQGGVVIGGATPLAPTTAGAAGDSGAAADREHRHPLPAVAAALTNTGDQIGLDFASQAEAEAGTATDKALNALGVAQAIAAQSGSARLDAIETNLAVNTLRDIEDAGWTQLEMVDGFADGFEDEAGVDGAASSGETYDASGDYYSTAASAQIAGGTGSNIGNLTGQGGLAAAFDGNTAQGDGSCAEKAGSTGTANTGTVGKDWGSGNTKTIAQAIIYGSTGGGFSGDSSPSVTVTIQGSSDNFSSDVNDLGSITFTDPEDNTAKTIAGLDTTTAYRYHRAKVESDNRLRVGELELFELTISDMTLVAAAQTADAQPDDARVVLVAQPVDAITLNTDLIAEVSRDDGTTWTAGTLVEEANYDANSKVYASGDIDISAQPSGTDMRVRIRTANTKEIRVHGWTLQWR